MEMLVEITIDRTLNCTPNMYKKECVKINRIHVKVTPEQLFY